MHSPHTPSPPSDAAASGGAGASGVGAESGSRSVISPGMLASVCARYDLGDVQRVYAFNRGSRRSPKAVVETARGRYLVKRRERGHDDPTRVASSHDLQLYLHAAGFPTPALLGTRLGNNSMVQLDGLVFEVFEFVEGESFDRTPGPCEDAGRQLAKLHELVRGYEPRWPSPVWNATAQHTTIARQLDEIARSNAAQRGTARQVVRTLRPLFARVAAGLAGRTTHDQHTQMLHADWHPGNMVFRGSTVAAVLDFDAARQGPVLFDLAGGALQFSMTRVGVDPDKWPDGLDAHRFAAFLRGYGDAALETDLTSLPATMAAALVGEVVGPIAATGSFAGQDAVPFLRMVTRKAAWLLDHTPKLAALAERSARGA